MPQTFSFEEAWGRTDEAGSLRNAPAIQSEPQDESWLDWAGRTVRNTADRIGLAAGVIDPKTYRGYGDPNAQPEFRAPAPRGLMERAGDAFNLSRGIGGQGEVGVLNRAVNDAFNWDDSFLAQQFPHWTPEQREAYRDQQMATQARELQGQAAMRDAADPIMREGDSWYSPGTLARFGAQVAGDLVGNANPSYLLGPGSTWLRRALAQGGINASIDVGSQAEMLGRDIQDKFSPEQTAIQFAAGFGMQSLSDAIPAAYRSWKNRGQEAPATGPADDGLMDVSLDGGAGPMAPAGGGAAAELIEFDRFAAAMPEELRGNPFIGAELNRQRSMLQEAATAEQVAARGPQTRNVPPEILAEREALQRGVDTGEMDPSYAPAPLAPRVVPDDVGMRATADGNVREDDIGAIVGLARDLEANQGVIDQAIAAQANSPLLRYILEQNVTDRTKVGQILTRLEELQRTGDEAIWRVGDQGNNPLDPAVNSAERTGAPTSPTMKELDEGTAGPYASPMATSGNRPFKDVPRADDRPEARGPEGFGPPPEGTPPRAGTNYWEDRYEFEAAEMVREWEASRARRAEEQARQRSQEKDAGTKYAGRAGKEPAQDDAGMWRMTDEGYIADAKGNPVAFKDAKAAAMWATRNRMAGDFELEVYGTNDARMVLRKKANSEYGKAQPKPEAEARAEPTEQGALPAPEQQRAPESDSGPSSSLADADGVRGGGDPSGRVDATSDAPAQPFDSARFSEVTSREDAGSPENRAYYEQVAGAEDAPRAAKVRAQKYLQDMGDAEATKPVTPKAEIGKTETVTTQAGREVETQFEVRELKDLQQAKGIRQPRDRSRDASDDQINDIASKLDPQRLKGNRLASQGSPIIGPDDVIEVGNGRTRAIDRAYDLFPEKAEAYKQMLRDEGYDIDGFERPILVRKRKTDIANDEDMRAWVNEAQEDGTLGMSAPEQAAADAAAIKNDTLGLYRGGDVNSAANREFIKAWSQDTRADPAALRASDGSLSREGVMRVESSLLARAFDDEALIGKLLGDTDDNIKAIGNVLRDTAGKFAQLKDAVADGRVNADFDITKEISEMAGLISRARANGEKMGDLLNQSDMFGKNVDALRESIARLMFKDDAFTKPRSQVRLKEAIDGYLDSALKSEEGAGMFGEALRPIDALEAVRTRAIAKENANGGVGQGRMLRLETKPFGKKRASLEDTKNGARGSLNAKLAEIVDGREADIDARDLAQRLLDFDETDVSLRIATQQELRTLDDGTIDKTIPSTISISGDFDPRTSTVRVGNARDIETILHEAIHARLIRRYGMDFSEATAADLASGDIAKLIRLYNDARTRYGKYGWANKAMAGHDVRYALSNVDEFIANAMTVPAVKRWLQKGTLWDRFVDLVRTTLGLPKRLTPMLDDVIRTGRNVLEKAKADAIRFAGDESGALDLQKLNKLVDKDGIVSDMKAVAGAVKNPKAALKTAASRIADGVGWATFSADGRGRVIAERFKSDAMHELLNHFHARAGRADEAVGQTWHEAVQQQSISRAQGVFRALEPVIESEASMRRVADLLRYPNRKLRASAAELEAAKALREQLKDVLEYRRAAGEDIGEVADGYFPRQIALDAVFSDRDGFIKAATKVYEDIGLSNKDAAGKAEAWADSIIDSYAGLDGGLDHVGAIEGNAVGARTAMARKFGKRADELLADFYENDPMNVLTSYMFGAARRAETARRFGKKGQVGSAERKAWEAEHGDKTQQDVLWDRIRDDLKDAGAEGAHAAAVMQKTLDVNLGKLGQRVSGATRATTAWMHTFGQLGTMDRSTMTSFGELMMGFTRGGMREGLPFIRDSLKQWYRQIKQAPPDDAQRWAEAIGVAQDAIVNTALTARAGIEMDTKLSNKVLQKFYQAILLHQYTEGTRIAATSMGRRFIETLAGDVNSKSARVRNRSTQYLRELGVSDPQAFAAALKKGISLDDVKAANSTAAKEYTAALIRFTNQTIMRPTRAEKPIWASHPVGSMLFSLMSYTYGFQKNVLQRAAKLSWQGVKQKDPTLMMPAAGLVGIMAFQQLNFALRYELFGGGTANEDAGPMETAIVAADRAGLTGGLSPWINVATGARYRRSTAESLIGPVLGRPAEGVDAMLGLAVNNSEKSNTAERKAAGALYDLAVEPAIDAYAALRGGQLVGTGVVLGTGVRNDEGLLPSDREAFVTALAGEKEE